MKIAGLQKVSLIDFPEKVAATVFLAGCNLDCGYCYNRWMLDESAVEEALSREALLAWLKT
ncbi:MAG: 4Fe-4S cluster-binding domain-containing protein, partial [Chloroflexi bacterium]|nr:4Fe-4S cluster-binding domain-containing protein [Chloroflexota bacterium]